MSPDDFQITVVILYVQLIISSGHISTGILIKCLDHLPEQYSHSSFDINNKRRSRFFTNVSVGWLNGKRKNVLYVDKIIACFPGADEKIRQSQCLSRRKKSFLLQNTSAYRTPRYSSRCCWHLHNGTKYEKRLLILRILRYWRPLINWRLIIPPRSR